MFPQPFETLIGQFRRKYRAKVLHRGTYLDLGDRHATTELSLSRTCNFMATREANLAKIRSLRAIPGNLRKSTQSSFVQRNRSSYDFATLSRVHLDRLNYRPLRDSLQLFPLIFEHRKNSSFRILTRENHPDSDRDVFSAFEE